MSGIITEKQYEIHYYEAHLKQQATITNIIDFFTDVSTFQSEELGVGINYMMENNMAWILYKWDINVERYPRYREKILAVTEPYSIKKFYAYRKFYILDENRNVIASAKSTWLLIDTKKRRPLRISEEMVKAFGLENKEETLEIENVHKLPEENTEINFKVRYSDIDTNGHVNNEKYVAWMIESIPRDIILNYTLKNTKITYKKETMYGESIKVITGKIKEDEDKVIFVHNILRENGELLTEGETLWEKNK
ncbi:acyl-ACP thioesterase [Clostridium novyi A str. 4570]|uniref:Acyl-ACP thioesterase n=1 Tax=Clostridium novyi A str. 4570 TaxID=1444290 RepID=A0AA88ZWY7_CLONO|nr:acyl-ACP thioesterase domain-containing protein [Clostridium novyi]KGN03187.1 acyl-ACP thioesterase [Clostridium novyi A str. 4570]